MVYPTLWRRGAPTAWEDVLGTRRELDQVLDRFLTTPAMASAWVPAVDVRETADALAVDVELPGLKRDDVSLSLENGVLTISGEKQRAAAEQDGDWHVAERRYGRFERSFTLPRTVDASRISATFTDGMLAVTLPKAETAKPRRIEIAVNGTSAV